MNVLYKYKPWNNWTKGIITNAKIFFPNPELFNDPFDCKYEIYSHQINFEFIEFTRFICKTALKNFFLSHQSDHITGKEKNKILIKLSKLGSIAEIISLSKSILHNLSIPYILNISNLLNFFEERTRNFGVLCLSSINNSILMWSHYADQHKGIVLGFERSHDNDLGDKNKCDKVLYWKSFPEVDIANIINKFELFGLGKPRVSNPNISDILINEILVRKQFYQKAQCWEYENEWRLIEPTFGYRPLPGKICEIIFGYKCSDGRIEEIKELATMYVPNPVKFYKVIPKRNSFDLLIHEF